MKKTFAYGAAASRGTWPVQEDGYFVNPSEGNFVLADGFGGKGNGDIAAKLCLNEWREPKAPAAPVEGATISPLLLKQREVFLSAQKKLLQWNEKRSGSAKGGSSLIAATLRNGNELALTGCGSCSALLFRQGLWVPLLTPQASPRRRAEDALIPDQALGLGKEIQLESRSFLLDAGDLIFLFSSGLYWERDGYLAELSSQLALRPAGGELGEVAAYAVGTPESPGPWNQAAVVVEALG